jgi:hypothetical protein
MGSKPLEMKHLALLSIVAAASIVACSDRDHGGGVSTKVRFDMPASFLQCLHRLRLLPQAVRKFLSLQEGKYAAWKKPGIVDEAELSRASKEIDQYLDYVNRLGGNQEKEENMEEVDGTSFQLPSDVDGIASRIGSILFQSAAARLSLFLPPSHSLKSPSDASSLVNDSHLLINLLDSLSFSWHYSPSKIWEYNNLLYFDRLFC